MEQKTEEQERLEKIALEFYTTYGKYKDLNFAEKMAIEEFFKYRNLNGILEHLKNNEMLSADFRLFIIEILNGSIKKPAGRPDNFLMDYEIYLEYGDCGLSLSEISNEILKNYPSRGLLTVDGVRKIFERMKPIIKEYNELMKAEAEY